MPLATSRCEHQYPALVLLAIPLLHRILSVPLDMAGEHDVGLHALQAPACNDMLWCLPTAKF